MFASASFEGTSFKFEQGRRYQNESQIAYVLPNDFNELDRLFQQHLMFRYVMQCNFHSPVSHQLNEGITVLDSGCGPGAWTLEMANTYPKSSFHGIDASKVFPENKPSNATFGVGNVASRIAYPDNTFNYIFQRLLFLGLTSEDWDKSLSELYRVVKHEGYVEFLEPDLLDVVNIGPCFQKHLNLAGQMMKSRGLCPEIGSQLGSRLKNTGFVNQKVVLYEFNMNHTDEAGKWFWEDFKEANLGLGPILGLFNPEWQDQKVYADFLEQIGLEAQANKTRVRFHVHYAQKPSLLQ